MSDCYAYGCEDPGDVRLKAWGPGEVRHFCREHAAVRRPLSGYSEVDR